MTEVDSRQDSHNAVLLDRLQRVDAVGGGVLAGDLRRWSDDCWADVRPSDESAG